MEIWEIVVLSLVGIVAGWLNVLAGGGSMLTVPTMIFMGMPGPVANGTNRLAIILQNITAVVTFAKKGFHNFKLSLSLSAAASIGAVFGAQVGVSLDGEWFNRILAIIMAGMMIIMWKGNFGKGDKKQGGEEPQRLVLGHILMIGAGFWGGFIQIGVGFILMPILHRVMGLNLVLTNVYKVFVILIYTFVALAVFASQLQLEWFVGLSLALGNAVGGYLGAQTTITKGENWIRWTLNIALVAFIIKLLFF
jgi:uncharacterized membrane protein YfcA